MCKPGESKKVSGAVESSVAGKAPDVEQIAESAAVAMLESLLASQ